MTKERALSDLLKAAFDVDDLRRFLSGLDAIQEIAAAEVNWNQSEGASVDEVVMILQRHRLVDPAFFDALHEARPRWYVDIVRARDRWLPDGTAPHEAEATASSTHCRLVLERELPVAREAVYRALRDRLPEVVARTSSIGGFERLYEQARTPGLWAGYLLRYDLSKIAVLRPLAALLSSMVDQLMTAGVHCIWNDGEYASYWYLDSMYFSAREVFRFESVEGRTRIHVECDYDALQERIVDSLQRGVADGLWWALQPHFESELRKNFEEIFDAAMIYLAEP